MLKNKYKILECNGTSSNSSFYRYPVIGYAGGNIVESGTKKLCEYYCETFEDILLFID